MAASDVDVIGWDLDMTLVDSRPGIAATLTELALERGTTIDVDLVVNRLGPMLETELANWFAPDEVDGAADRYRELYVTHGVPGTVLMPGAADAVRAAHDAGWRNVVITAKFEPNAIACLAHVGLGVDAVIGWRHGPAKGETLVEHGASIYVGDTPADIDGARSASAVAVGVTSGPHNADELRDAGADVVFASLTEFAPWFNSRRSL
jgi:phosphoglycolate phosphatase